MLCLPTITAPVALSLRTTSASSDGMRLANTALPHVVLTPAVSNRSLRPMGIPCSGPRHLPACASASNTRACASACSAITVMYALTRGFSLSVRARHARVSSTGEILPRRICSDAWVRVQSVGEDDGVCAVADAANSTASASRRVGVEGMIPSLSQTGEQAY